MQYILGGIGAGALRAVRRRVQIEGSLGHREAGIAALSPDGLAVWRWASRKAENNRSIENLGSAHAAIAVAAQAENTSCREYLLQQSPGGRVALVYVGEKYEEAATLAARIETELAETDSLLTATSRALLALWNSYAVAVIASGHPNEVVIGCLRTPLYVASANRWVHFASDEIDLPPPGGSELDDVRRLESGELLCLELDPGIRESGKPSTPIEYEENMVL